MGFIFKVHMIGEFITGINDEDGWCYRDWICLLNKRGTTHSKPAPWLAALNVKFRYDVLAEF